MKLRLTTLAILVGLAAGCGEESFPTATLSGSVTVDGESLKQGTISFTPLEQDRGKAVVAEIQDGRYQAEAVPLGRVRVMFHATEETGKMLTDSDTGEPYPEKVSLIAEKYQTSGEEITVDEGEGTEDFELTSE